MRWDQRGVVFEGSGDCMIVFNNACALEKDNLRMHRKSSSLLMLVAS